MKKKTLHIYCRVSTEQQVEFGHSLGAQEKAGIQKAGMLGMNHVVCVEKGKSAAKDDLDNRPVLKQLLDDCDDGLVTDIFVTEMDRLTRSPVTQIYIKKVMVDNGIILHTALQTINLRDEEQEFFADLTALLSRRENTIRAKRSKRGLREAAVKGRWIGGVMIPYGFRRKADKTFEIDHKEAKIIQMIYKLSLSGQGTNTIARKLNDLGIETRGRKVLKNGIKIRNKHTKIIHLITQEEIKWAPNTVYTILKNPIFKGERRYCGETIKVPAIIDERTWNEVQLQLKKNKHYSSNHSKHFYLLKGLLRCGRCGNNLYGVIKVNSGENHYMCSSKRGYHSCKLRSVNIDKLNNAIWGLVTDNKAQIECIRKELGSMDSNTRIINLGKKRVGVEKQILEIESRKQNLIVLFEKGKITLETFDLRSASLDKEKNELGAVLEGVENELLVLNSQINSLEELKNDGGLLKVVNNWDDNQKREFLNRKVKNIVVHWNEDFLHHTIEIAFEAGFKININKLVLLGKKESGLSEKIFKKDRFLFHEFQHFDKVYPLTVTQPSCLPDYGMGHKKNQKKYPPLVTQQHQK